MAFFPHLKLSTDNLLRGTVSLAVRKTAYQKYVQ
jgi:hypothetical protein